MTPEASAAAQSQPEPVLDASALLAYLGGEPGAGVVADAIAGGARLSIVNLAETLSTLAARGRDLRRSSPNCALAACSTGAITVDTLTSDDAIEIARLRPLTRASGLSLTDRACLALGSRHNTTVITTDHAWTTLELGHNVLLARPVSTDS